MLEVLCCDDILQNIFQRLPAKDLLKIKPVCKSWKRMIEDPLFVKSHTKIHQSAAASILIRKNKGGKLFSLPIDRLDYRMQQLNPLKQLIHRGVPRLADLPAPSCNGLILITHEDDNKSWAIWNPLTQDSHLVPPPLADPGTHSASFSLKGWGFGYDEASDDYKVVWVGVVSYRNTVNSYQERAMIYSLKLRGWRAMKSLPGPDCRGVGVYLNGALHWKSRRDDRVFVLHLGREDHQLVAAPPRPSLLHYSDRQWQWQWESLDAVDGCLIMSYKDERQRKRSVDLWVMKDYETKEWTKLFSVVDQSRVMDTRVVGYLKSKGQVFIMHGRRSGLKWVDLESKWEKEITFSGVGDDLCFGQLLPGSLVRLDGTMNTRVGVRVRVGVKRKRPIGKRDVAYACF